VYYCGKKIIHILVTRAGRSSCAQINGRMGRKINAKKAFCQNPSFYDCEPEYVEKIERWFIIHTGFVHEIPEPIPYEQKIFHKIKGKILNRRHY